MARKPLFSGNYGSALARVDTAPIVGAGRAQGQTFKQIGGMIQQYQLNKEKRQAEEDAAVGGLMGLSPESLKQFTSRNPKVGSAVEKIINGTHGEREVSQVNAALAPFNASQLRDLQMRAAEGAIESRELANSIAKELEETKIQLVKDQATLSNINVKVEKMKEAGLTKRQENMLNELGLIGMKLDAASVNLPYKTEAERQAALLSSATSKAGIGLVVPRAEATQAALTTSVMANEQKQNLMPGQTSIALKKQELDSEKIDIENFLIDAHGGAKGKAKFDYRGEEIKREHFEKGLEYLDARIDYTKYLSTAKNVPVDTKKQYASLVSHAGKILDTTVKDPDTGNQITFQEYMEKANDDPDLYPLTGAGSGAAGVLYGNFQNAQKQINDFGKTIQVQVDDGQGTGSSPAPTGSPINVGNMQPEQAMQALQDRIGELRRLGPDINAQRQQLGQPGQLQPTYQIGVGGTMGGTLSTNQVPQTVGYIQQQNDALTQQEEQRKAELAKAEAQLQELQNQFGVR